MLFLVVTNLTVHQYSSGLPSFLYPYHALAGLPIGSFWFKAVAGRGDWCAVLSILSMDGGGPHIRCCLALPWPGAAVMVQGPWLVQRRLTLPGHIWFPPARTRAQCRPDSRITNIMKSLVIAAALLVAGAVARPGGYTGVNITSDYFLCHCDLIMESPGPNHDCHESWCENEQSCWFNLKC